MKKLSTLISVLFLGSALSLAACKKDDEKKTDDKAAKPEEKKPEEAKPEEKKPEEAKPADQGGGAAATGLAECDAYVAAMEKYLACDKVPQAARDGAKQGLDAMKGSWGDTAGMPEEAKKAANDACKQAVDALKQGASAMGCTI
jgi:hypothetical protein